MAAYLPILGMCSEQMNSYQSLIDCIMSKKQLLKAFMETLPFAMQILAQKIQNEGHKTKGGKTQQAMPSLEVTDRVKQTILAMNRYHLAQRKASKEFEKTK